MADVVSNITLADLEKLKGYVEEKTKSPYEIKRLRNKDHLLILYTTGKLVVQGENSPFPVDQQKNISSPSQDIPELAESIGSDETLKGDTFGGIVVCAAYFKQHEIDVKDSKSYTDAQIEDIATALLQKYPDRFCVKALTPEQYNQLYAELGSQTAMLNLLHHEVAKELQEQHPSIHVVDQYPGCQVGDVAVTQAESHYTSVAAASIIARYEAIKQFKQLSKEAGFTLPKGSTHVKDALYAIKEKKLKIDLFCKIHFSTVANL